MKTKLVRRMLRTGSISLSSVIAAVSLVSMSNPATASDCGELCVIGNPQPQQYQGSLLLPPSLGDSQSPLVSSAAHCSGCIWRISANCATGGPHAHQSCVDKPDGCIRPQVLSVLWRQRPEDLALRRVGLFCFGPGNALTPEGLVPGVRDQFVKLLPKLTVTFQPTGRTLVNLPTLFDTHQPPNLGRPQFTLGGHRIVLTATAHWAFDFGDGETNAFDVPGGPYPNQDIAHPYGQPGDFSVTVTTTWTGQFTVDGLGPFPVTGPNLSQRQVITVPVKEARAVIVG